MDEPKITLGPAVYYTPINVWTTLGPIGGPKGYIRSETPIEPININQDGTPKTFHKGVTNAPQVS